MSHGLIETNYNKIPFISSQNIEKLYFFPVQQRECHSGLKNKASSKEPDERVRKEDFPSLCVFNDALTIELNFNGKSRLMC